ncbi:DUF1294 domain-containing protein [Halioglobus maricola]|uniref:DUF1294 domain-containing protein n=1 Tax=Halioglobus maricola TaxID=2601894 RepID=A0A5P9NKJ3_9GAMM|nr:cold shock and DUF1294 domain-containing protein [Halioglobus maricola]QFU76252.1 DUF1294 domain-containing protein [Halioglobus maricola]
MRKSGEIRSWNDEKGFGFIEPSDGGKQLFLHVSDLEHRNRRPQVGQAVTYAISKDKQGRPCAVKATLPGGRLYPVRNSVVLAIMVATIFLAIVAASVVAATVPAFILWTYLAASFVTFVLYALDKSAAKSDSWRTRESTFHWLSLAGGWPGALVAQQTLRHKSRKQSFRLVFWLTVVLNCAGYIWLMTPAGAEFLHDWAADGANLFEPRPGGTIEWAE